MRLDCKITDLIREDFNALWRCSQRGETLEISTPYRMPDSTLFTLFLTERGNRFIACDGGRIAELLTERCELPQAEWRHELGLIAKEHGMKEGSSDGVPVFFKDCREQKLISSIAFDVANFATMAANILVSMGEEEEDEEETEKETRFSRDAHRYIETVKRPDQTLLRNHRIIGGPDLQFSAVVRTSSNLWIFLYIGGADVSQFRKNISDAALSFKEARHSRIASQIKATVPILNSRAKGYKRRKLIHRISELEHEAHQSAISFLGEKYLIPRILA